MIGLIRRTELCFISESGTTVSTAIKLSHFAEFDVLARPMGKKILTKLAIVRQKEAVRSQRRGRSSQSLAEGSHCLLPRADSKLASKRLKGRQIVDLCEDELGIQWGYAIAHVREPRPKDRWRRRRIYGLKSIYYCYVVHGTDVIRSRSKHRASDTLFCL